MFEAGCKSICGIYHDGCQDYSEVKKVIKDDEEITIAAVADGLGSEINSAEGAKIAVKTVIEYIENNFFKEIEGVNEFDTRIKISNIIREGYVHAVEEIEKKAKENEAEAESYGTTLMVVVTTKDYTYYGHSGDGAIIRIAKDGEITTLTMEQSGMFGGEVFPIMSGEYVWSFGAERNEEALSYIVVTDGVLSYINGILQNDENTKKYFSGLIGRAVNEKKDNLDEHMKNCVSLKRLAEKTGDDKTMAILVRKDAVVPAYEDYYFNSTNCLSPSNSEGEEYGLDAEKWMETYCFDNQENYDGKNYLLENEDNYVVGRIINSEEMKEIESRKRLYKCLDIAFNSMYEGKKGMLEEAFISCERDEELNFKLSDYRVFFASYFEGTNLQIYEYGGFSVVELTVDKKYLAGGVKIGYLLAPYYYTYGRMLASEVFKMTMNREE